MAHTLKSFSLSSQMTGFIYEIGLEVYVVKNIDKKSPGINFDISSISAHKPGKGKLTKFLDRYEPLFGLYIENILSARLRQYFIKRGYVECNKNPHSLLKERLGIQGHPGDIMTEDTLNSFSGG